MTAQEYKCKTCGAILDISQAVGGVLECPFCYNTYPLPKEDADETVRSFLSIGEHDLDRNDFNGAYAAYDKARQLSPEEPEAYRGMALAECQVRYLQDTVNNRLQPICYLHDGPSFANNENYKRALSLATPEQKADYRKKAEEIDYIHSEFRKLRDRGEDYDCFICVKVTDDDGVTKTEDYRAADEIYDLLKRRGYSPFFSERTIQNKTGVDYEAEILYALYTSETMLVVCRKEKYLHTKWVQNEYMRFLKLVNDEEKESDSITTVFYGTPIERLPGRGGKLQGIDYKKSDAAVKILEFVENHTPRAKAKREELARQKEREAEEIRKQIEEQRREFEKQQQLLQQELEGKLQNIQAVGGVNSGATASVNSLLKRAYQEIEFNNIPEARAYFNKVLDIEPENHQAWWGLFLLDYNVKHENKLEEQLNCELCQRIENNRNYLSGLNYSKNKSDSIAKRIAEFAQKLRSSKTWWNIFLRNMQANSVEEVVNMAKQDVGYLHAISTQKELFTAAKFIESADKETVRNLQTLQEKIASYRDDSTVALALAEKKLSDLECEERKINTDISDIEHTIEGRKISENVKKEKIRKIEADTNIVFRPNKTLVIAACVAVALLVGSAVLLIKKIQNESNIVVIIFLITLSMSLLASSIISPCMYRNSVKNYKNLMTDNERLNSEKEKEQKNLDEIRKELNAKQQQLTEMTELHDKCIEELCLARNSVNKLRTIKDTSSDIVNLLE